MKFCSGCQTTKPVVEFGKNRARHDGLQGLCKPCRRIMARSWYSDHRGVHVSRVTSSRDRARHRNRDYVLDYLSSHPCVDCASDDLEVLEFDHRNPDEKEYNVSVLLAHGAALTKLVAEIAKCDVRCANCHRRRTARQFAWYKVDIAR